MVLSMSGDPHHFDNEDPKRILFEMTKQEFTDENFCEFCCKKLADKQEIMKHQEKVKHFAKIFENWKGSVS